MGSTGGHRGLPPAGGAARWLRTLAALSLAAILAACGSGDDDGPQIRRLITFGDSISDMGTYQVGAIAALGGGQFTVNPGPNWTQRVADELGYTISPHYTGGFGYPALECVEPKCSNWAMGGSRVTLRPGFREAPDGSTQLSYSVKNQIDRHLELFKGFDNNDLISLQAGGNDLFVQLESIPAMIQGGMTVEQAAATVVIAMGTAGAELASHVKNDILARGAKMVVVWELFDIAGTPFGQSLDAQSRALITAMTEAFNGQLYAGLSGSAAKIFPARQLLQAWLDNPGNYGFSDATIPACSAEKIFVLTQGQVADGSSLFCSEQTLLDVDTSRFLFADAVHPAPYTHQLVAENFLAAVHTYGWR